MKHVFKKINHEEISDIIYYIKEKIEIDPTLDIYVGCDSQNDGKQTVYACVIVLHYNKNGGHVLYAREKVSRIYDRFTRLWKEVEFSLEIAQFLESNGIKVKFVDLDINPDPKYGSNMVLRAALGFVESYGFEVRVKPKALAASYCADHFCH